MPGSAACLTLLYMQVPLIARGALGRRTRAGAANGTRTPCSNTERSPGLSIARASTLQSMREQTAGNVKQDGPPKWRDKRLLECKPWSSDWRLRLFRAHVPS